MIPSSWSRARDRRSRQTFWIDDRVIDDFAPVMSRYPFGAAALAVYAVLARRADREGDALVLIGSSTGRDGIGGASVLASQEFDDASDEKRPSVQVGDPLTSHVG